MRPTFRKSSLKRFVLLSFSNFLIRLLKGGANLELLDLTVLDYVKKMRETSHAPLLVWVEQDDNAGSVLTKMVGGVSVSFFCLFFLLLLLFPDQEECSSRLHHRQPVSISRCRHGDRFGIDALLKVYKVHQTK